MGGAPTHLTYRSGPALRAGSFALCSHRRRGGAGTPSLESVSILPSAVGGKAINSPDGEDGVTPTRGGSGERQGAGISASGSEFGRHRTRPTLVGQIPGSPTKLPSHEGLWEQRITPITRMEEKSRMETTEGTENTEDACSAEKNERIRKGGSFVAFSRFFRLPPFRSALLGDLCVSV
jgi:hypothetical protein